jgi:hypothetical protein
MKDSEDSLRLLMRGYVNRLVGILIVSFYACKVSRCLHVQEVSYTKTKLSIVGSTPADGVVILGSFCDGSLLTRAVRSSMGEKVRIFGASGPCQDVTYMARLRAQVVRDRTTKEMEEGSRKQAVEDLVEEDRVHEEL